MNSPFDYVKSILYPNKEYMMNNHLNEGEYIPWITNRALSVHSDCIFYVQELNKYPFLNNKMQYDFYYHSIRKTKRIFISYPNNKKNECFDIVSQLYKYSPRKTAEALRLLSKSELNELTKIFEKGGTK